MSEEKKGELYLAAEIALWSFFPILAHVLVAEMSPVLTAGISTLCAALFFIAWVTYKSEWMYMWNAPWKDMLLSTLCIGVLFYGILFVGASYTTAGNTAIFLLAQVFFAFLLLTVFVRLETAAISHWVGAGLMLVGALIVLYPHDGISVDVGSLIVAGSTVFAPIGNWYAKKATRIVSPAFLMMVRSVVAGVVLTLVGCMFEEVSAAAIGDAWLFLVVNGVVLFGVSKLLWLEAIRRMSISKATAIITVEPFITLVFAYLVLSEVPTIQQLAGALPLCVGVYIITRKSL